VQLKFALQPLRVGFVAKALELTTLGKLTMCNLVKMVTLQSCVQLTVHVTVSVQIWFKNLVKIWSKSGQKKFGQNLVKIWFAKK
jgi:hypothetical protein